MKRTVFRTLGFLISFLLILQLGACGGGNNQSTQADSSSSTQAGQTNESKKEEAANAAESSSTQGEESKTVRVAVSETMIRLDPHDQMNVVGRSGIFMVLEPLIKSDHAGNFTPLIADSWEFSEDQKDITFHLHEGIKDSNGNPFNADDVCATYNRILSDEAQAISTRTSYFPTLNSIEKVDDLTVVFHYNTPDCMAMDYISYTPIFTNEEWDEYGEQLWLDQHMTGTGPWKWGEWVDGQYLHLVKNEDYWNKENYDPYYDEFYMMYITEESAAIAAHLAGDVDAYISTGGISPENVALFDGHEDIDCFEKSVGLYHFLGFQCEEGKIFNDINLRRAFSMAFDREEIGKELFGENVEASRGGLAFSFNVGYDETLDSEYFQNNPEGAKALIDASSYNGEPINFLIGTNVPRGEDIGLLISEACQAVGLNVVVEMAEIATYQSRRLAGEYDVYVTFAEITFGEIYEHMHLRIVEDCHKSHYTDNEEFNQLVTQAGQTLDTEMRAELYKKCDAIIADQVPHASLFCEPKTYSISKKITGIELYSDGGWNFDRIDYANK